MNQDSWISSYQKKRALWLHDGNVKQPHALLTSGKHSDGFFNSELVMEDSNLLGSAALDLFNSLILNKLEVDTVFRVVGPAMGAITLAHDLSHCFSHGRKSNLYPCLCAYTEKEGEGENLRMVFKRTVIQKGEHILLCEDVLTTGGSVEMTMKAVEEAGGIILPFVALLINRSGLSEVKGKKIVALINKPMSMWKADECPLCKQGSEAIRPKGKENWARLNATC